MPSDAPTIYIVGAGPGDPDLLTLRAARLIRNADVILHDHLVSDGVLALARPRAQLISVGKRCGKHAVSQSAIHELMIHFARLGRSVVRLKGGDPCLFGRLAEELLSLKQAGVHAELVPGIGAASAAAASASVSLTRRGAASSVLLATGRLHSGQRTCDWRFAAQSGSTLAIYMPGDLAALAHDLIFSGFAPHTPCLAVSSATTPAEQRLSCSLAELGNCEPLSSPVVVLVGAALRDEMFHSPEAEEARCL